MTYTYGLHGAPAVGGGLPGLPQRGASLSGRDGLVKVSLDAFSGVPYGKQVSRADYPSLSDALPPTMLCQSIGCQAIPDAALPGTSSLAWSDDGKFLIGSRTIKSVEDDIISDLFSPTSTSGPASVDENGETFAYRSNSNQVSVVNRSGATFSTPVVLGAGSSDSVVDVTMRPDGLSCVVAITSSSTFLIREYKRATKSTTTWTGPTSVGSTATGTCRAAQFDRVNGNYLAAAVTTRGLELYQRISGVYTLIQTISGTYSGDTRIAWSPDGLKVAVVRSTSLNIYSLESNVLSLLKTFDLSSSFYPGVCWHDNKTVLVNVDQHVIGTNYTNRTIAFDLLSDNALQLWDYTVSASQGGIASSGKYIAICRDSRLYIRGSTKQVIASIAQPDIYIG